MISIIIPTFNEEKYLPKLLDCIKIQTYKNYEVIVADANSKDKTRQIAKKYGCKVVKGGMPGIGRNNGAKAAKGNILLFLDADVLIKEDFLKKSIKELQERDIQVSGCYLIPDSKNIFYRLGYQISNTWFFLMQYFYPQMTGQCIFSANYIHGKLHGFDPTISFAEDSDYVNRSKKFCKFRILRSVKITSSVRRLENENIVLVTLKYILCTFYRMIFGEVRSNIFRYRLGSSEKRN